MSKEYYNKMKELGLCVNCGGDRGIEKALRCHKCKLKSNIKGKQWRDNNKDHCKDYFNNLWKTIREEAFAAYGNKCSKCGETQCSVLELDHINDDGGAERKYANGYSNWMKNLKKNGYPDNIQILCSNCHSKKRAVKADENSKIRGRNKRYSPYRDAVIGYGAKCSCCSFNDLDCLELHHVNGGGRKEIEEKGGWRNYFRELKKANYPEAGVVVLCANCHTNITKNLPCYH